eukprot:GEZU01011119.1.p1 GENE.GEZU01011119.1~~GEZU01011119.1.p1  ORF type:complete len:768 (-),score=341.27 GEZU01011119.1:60-2363(-)
MSSLLGLGKSKAAPAKKQPTDTKTTASKVPVLNFEEGWAEINAGIQRLIEFLDTDMKKPFSYSEGAKIYSTVFNLCTQKVDMGKLSGNASEVLYERYGKAISDYLVQKVVPTLKEKQGSALLMEAVHRWRNHQIVVKWMIRLFSYLDRYYTKHNNRDSLRDVGLKNYQTLVYESIKVDMARALLDKIHAEREGELIDKSVMKDGVQLFIEMGLNSLTAYEKGFEAPLIAETASFYKRESQKWISEDSCPVYMKKAEKRLQEEQARAQAYLHESSEPNIIKTSENELITAHAKTLLEMENSGFIAQLKNYQVEDLSRMYRLFNRVNLLKPMADMMRDYLTQEGMAIVKKHQAKENLECDPYINELLDMHEKYSVLVNEHFKKNSLFLEAMKDAFTTFVNTELVNEKTKTRTSTAELLSTYCDNLMRNPKVEEGDLDAILEKVVRLFGYIAEKDMFQEFYRRQLSKRLLVHAKPNIDAERSLITKLKMRCGASFTSKFEGMITDKNLSEDLQQQFRDWINKRNLKMDIDFSPQVLTTGFWPAFKIDSLTVPPEMQRCINQFKDFYDSRTQSRLLKWVHSLGSNTVNAIYEKGDKEITCSTYQACILLLFNQTPELTAADIQKSLNIPLDEVKRNLLSFSVGKYKILNKSSGASKNIAPTDTFSVNADFQDKNRRIKPPNIVFVINEEDRQNVQQVTNEDRKHAIEAAIVRVMKARKQLEHQQLVLAVMEQLMAHFKPDPKVIKRRIEDLITREYLERDPNKASLYKYLA